MSEGEGPEPEAGEGPGVGAILIGIFLILFGICLSLVGGGCAALWIVELVGAGYVTGTSSGLPTVATMLTIALVTLAAGVLLLRVSIKMLSGKYRK
jgi:hypothetical protein